VGDLGFQQLDLAFEGQHLAPKIRVKIRLSMVKIVVDGLASHFRDASSVRSQASFFEKLKLLG
jgi:hypothetical protein